MTLTKRTFRAATAIAVAASVAFGAPSVATASGAPPGPSAGPATAATTGARTVAPGAAATERSACDAFTEPQVTAAVPTAEDVIGVPIGQRDVTIAESDRYLRAVSAASPRVRDGVLARSWNGRPLRYAVVGKPRWIRPPALARIGHRLNLLRDAETSPARARRLVRNTPAVLWLAGNVHGNEESGTDASLRVLYELAARTDCTARQILDRAVVVVLPSQNPDGREADTRRNAYGFDLNRDWFARTQPETDGKVAALRRLPPQLFIDDHEMGSEDFFFPPNADPVYHDIGETPLGWIYDVYGPAMQQAFDRFSIPYFNGSAYDLLYMGYGDTVPAAGFNAAGMTFEKNNAEPTEVRVQEQYTAVWATLMAAGGRHSLLREWRAEHVKAARQGARGFLEPNRLYYEGGEIENQVPRRRVRHYFLRADDPAKATEVARLVDRLRGMDVDVYRLRRPLRVPDYRPYGRHPRAVTLPAGTVWVPMAQGQKHWVQAMLNEDTYVPFPYFYDVTAFSQPLLDNVAGGSSGRVLRPQARTLTHQRVVPRPRVAGAPRVAVWQVSEESSSAIESAGWLRWWLDRRQRLLYADVSATDIADGGLDGVEVLVVPNGSDQEAADALGPDGQQALVDWVAGGGTLVTLRNSSLLASRLGLTTATAVEPTSDIPGSLVRIEVDRSSPLARGVGRTAYAMYEYDYVWSTPGQSGVVARFPEAGDPDWFVSGFASGQHQLKGGSAVVDQSYGEGRVVLFGFDPNYRAFTNGTATMLGNAILGPRPEDPARAPQLRRPPERPSVTPLSDRMVLTVRPRAAAAVQGMLDRYRARAERVVTPAGVSFRVDLGGVTADQHPWARSLADDVAGLGTPVVAIGCPDGCRTGCPDRLPDRRVRRLRRR